jgi:hypothetical protein
MKSHWIWLGPDPATGALSRREILSQSQGGKAYAETKAQRERLLLTQEGWVLVSIGQMLKGSHLRALKGSGPREALILNF